MAGESGQQKDRLSTIVETARQGVGHFHAIVTFLERVLHPPAHVGDDGPVAQEAIRFRHDAALAFATSDVSSIDLVDVPYTQAEGGAERIVEMVTTFLGLTGGVSPLPAYLAEEVAQEPAAEPVLRDFYDVFHHRILSLFYRATTRYSHPLAFASDCQDPWSRRALAFVGIDTYEHPPAAKLPPWQLLRLAALVATRRPTLWVLETALCDVLHDSLEGAALRIEQFVGSWIPLDDPEQMRLGRRNSRLGVDLVIGRSAFDRAGKFRVVVGPCSREVFYRFRNDAAVHRLVVETVKLFCRDPLEFDLGIILAADQLPGFRVSGRSPQRLGVDSFLGSQRQREVVVSIGVTPAATLGGGADPPPAAKPDAPSLRRTA